MVYSIVTFRSKHFLFVTTGIVTITKRVPTILYSPPGLFRILQYFTATWDSPPGLFRIIWNDPSSTFKKEFQPLGAKHLQELQRERFRTERNSLLKRLRLTKTVQNNG